MSDTENQYPKVLYKYDPHSNQKLGSAPVATQIVETEGQEQLAGIGGYLPVDVFYRKHVSFRHRAGRAIAAHWSKHWGYWITTAITLAGLAIAVIKG